jgi:aminopeptidase-like protein
MKKYYQLGKKLFPINRSITGAGVRKTLKILSLYVPNLKITKVKSRTKAFDWTIPDEWNVRKAYIQDKFGNKIIDFKDNNLHLLGYSIPKKIKISKKKLLKHLYFLKNYPDAIPYITSYYKKRWGFCLSYNSFKKNFDKFSNKDSFFVNIETRLNPKGHLNYGEAILKGKSDKEIFLSTYICHPSMANNELSGPLIATALYNYFKKKKNKYTIRFIFIPETIGSICYLSKNYKTLKKKVVAGFNLTCLGDDKNYSFLPSKYSSASNDAAFQAFKKLKINFKYYSFLERGSDERQYNSPGVDLPIASIMRSKYGTYKEYHTSKDDFNLVTIKGLKGGFTVLKNAIEILNGKELNPPLERKKFKNFPSTQILCEPQMSKRKLYPSLGFKNSRSKKVKDIMNFLQYADGSNSIKDITKIIKISEKKSIEILKLLKNERLVK